MEMLIKTPPVTGFENRFDGLLEALEKELENIPFDNPVYEQCSVCVDEHFWLWRPWSHFIIVPMVREG